MCLAAFETEFISAFFSEKSLCAYQEGQVSLLFGELNTYCEFILKISVFSHNTDLDLRGYSKRLLVICLKSGKIGIGMT